MKTITKKFLTLFLIISLLSLPQYGLAAVGDWTHPADVPNIVVKAIAVSPNFAFDKTVFAGSTGTNSNGIYRSTNSGANWTSINLPNNSVQAVALSPDYSPTSGKVYAGTANGVYMSSSKGDAGTWGSPILTGTAISALAIAPSPDKTVFIGTNGEGMYTLTAADTTLTRISISNTDLNTDAITAIAISSNYSTDKTVFAATSNNGVFRLKNNGLTWSVDNLGIPGSPSSIKALAIANNFTETTGTVFADGHKTTNSGNTWTDSTSTTPSNITSLAISPNFSSDATIFAGTSSNGVYISDNSGTTWRTYYNVNSGSASSNITSLAISPNFDADGLLFAGTSGSGVYVCATKSAVTAPTVTSTSPVSGVAIGNNITVTFSEDITEGSLYNDISLKTGGNTVALSSGNKSISGRTLTINPSSDLAYATSYVLTLPGSSIKDTAGYPMAALYSLTFTTATQSNGSPSVSSIDPSNGATGVSKSKTITITFGDNISSGSSYDSIKFKNPNGAEIKTNKSISNKVLTIDPIVDLERSGEYTVFLPATSLRYSNGNSLTSDQTYTFKVSSGVTGPVVVSTTPADNTTEFSKGSDISVAFDVDLQTGSNYNDIALKDPSDNKISASLSISSKTLTINPSSDLISGAKYTVTIPTSSVKDSSGNSMSYQYKFGFRAVKDSTAPSAPQSLSASSVTNATRLSWANNQEADLAGYNIYRKQKNVSGYSKLNSSLITSNPYNDTTIEVGKTYTYYITAVDRSENESNKSSEIDFTAVSVLGQVVFSDVSADSWYASYVSKLLSLKIFNGYPNGTFQPGKTISRAEFAKAIVLVMGWSLTSPSSPSFQDVPKSNWAYSYVETAHAKGIVNGYASGDFRPNNSVTRAEITQMISLALNLSGDTSSYSDTSDHWGRNYIGACMKAGIVSGYPDNTFKPNNSATRAEAAKMLVKTYEKK